MIKMYDKLLLKLLIILVLVVLTQSYYYLHYNYNKLRSIPRSSQQLYMNSITISEDERLRLRGELLDLCDDFTEKQKLKWNNG
jgi:hypothetical protein